jgi:hypothetical protein
MSLIRQAVEEWMEGEVETQRAVFVSSIQKRRDQLTAEEERVPDLWEQSAEELDYTARIIVYALYDNSISYRIQPVHEIVRRFELDRDQRHFSTFDLIAMRFLRQVWDHYVKDCRNLGAKQLRVDARLIGDMFGPLLLHQMLEHPVYVASVKPERQLDKAYELLRLVVYYTDHTELLDEKPVHPQQRNRSLLRAALEQDERNYAWMLQPGLWEATKTKINQQMDRDAREFQQLLVLREKCNYVSSVLLDNTDSVLRQLKELTESTVRLTLPFPSLGQRYPEQIKRIARRMKVGLGNTLGQARRSHQQEQFVSWLGQQKVEAETLYRTSQVSEDEIQSYLKAYEETEQSAVQVQALRTFKLHYELTLQLLDRIQQRSDVIRSEAAKQVVSHFLQRVADQRDDVDKRIPDEAHVSEKERQEKSMLEGLMERCESMDAALQWSEWLAEVGQRAAIGEVNWRKAVEEYLLRETKRVKEQDAEGALQALPAFWKKRKETHDAVVATLPAMIQSVTENHAMYQKDLATIRQLLANERQTLQRARAGDVELVVRRWTQLKVGEQQIPARLVLKLLAGLPRGGADLLVDLVRTRNDRLEKPLLKQRLFLERRILKPIVLARAVSKRETLKWKTVYHMILVIYWLWMEMNERENIKPLTQSTEPPLPRPPPPPESKEREEKYPEEDEQSSVSTRQSRVSERGEARPGAGGFFGWLTGGGK